MEAIIAAIIQALMSAFDSYNKNKSEEEALLAAEEELSKARARAKFAKK